MKIELQEKLEHDHPFLNKSGCLYSCADGWYDLIDELCGKISERYKLEGKEPDIIIEEIKEKYGALRVEYQHDNFSDDDAEPENGYFLCGGIEVNLLEINIACLVDEYEEKSKTVCEMCGAQGKLREDLPWIQTLCVSCYAEQVKRVR